MKHLLRLPVLAIAALLGQGASAQCTPVNCLPSLPPAGGLCASNFAVGRVNVPYADAISFHVTNACSPATDFDPTLTGASLRITQMGGFTFTNLPVGLSGTTNQATYTPPANGCGAITGTPTQAGVFNATVNLLVNVNVWPFSLNCGGFGPIAQNNNAISQGRELVILPDPSFTGPAEVVCADAADVALVVTGTPGGSFSGPGVSGTTFSPALAGVGTHTITYTVSAQQGSAIAPATDSFSITVTVESCVVVCEAEAGSLSGGGEVCLEDGSATLTATPDGNTVVPAGYQVLYVLTEGAGLVIVDAGAAPEFTVDAEGTYTIHTLVYDPNTLDLSIVELGVTTGFDVNGLLIQGGGSICASLDVAGAAFSVETCVVPCTANAGTLSGGGNACLEDGSATLTATPDGNTVVPAGYQVLYVLTEGAGLVIVDAGAAPEFTVDAEGTYTIHTLVYDPNTLDLSIVELGVTTGFDVNGLLIQGGGSICASLDVAGAAFSVETCVVPCTANAGTLSGGGNACLEDGSATLTATPDGNTVVPAGYQVLYALTEGAGLVIVDAGAAPEFTVDAEGTYTIHTLVYDPNTLDLSIVELGVTTGFDVNGLLIQGGGSICASLDVAGAAFTVEVCAEPCLADAGNLSGGGAACLEDGSATLSATPDGNAVVPAGFETLYVLTEGPGLVIINAGAAPEFTVDAEGTYTIHTLVYDPTTLDLSIVELGVTTGFDVNGLLIQGGGSICASLDVAGAFYEVVVCGTYCAAGATSTSFEKISNVTFGSINNSSTSTAGYEDFTSVSGTFAQGSTYGITVTISNGFEPDEVLVWIDYDQNGVFTSNELAYNSPLGVGPHSGTITIPANALLGSTRMRVRLHDSSLGANNTPCGNSTYGQVEDYTVNIIEAFPPCDAFAGTLTALPNGCVVDEVTLSAEPNGNAVVPDGFEVLYVLTEGAGLVIINAGAEPEFTVTAAGTYTIHTLVYDPATLDLSIVELGVTTGFDVNGLLQQGGGLICASLDVAGAVFTVAVCGQYCEAGATNTSATFEKIANVTFANIDNSSTSTEGYEDFTTIVGNVARGGSYDITVTISNPFEDDEVLVWIDLDQNSSFEPSELVYNSPLGEGPHSGTIDIPLNAALGQTRMRVRLHDSALGGNPTPCGNSTYGQVEDYSLNIEISTGLTSVENIPVTAFPNPTMGDLFVRLGVDDVVVLELFDALGRAVHTEQRTTTADEVIALPIGGKVAPGTYVLRITGTTGRNEQRIVVGR